MSQIVKNMLFLAVFLIICGVSKAAIYHVGDSSGWTSIGHVDYKSWAASKHFHVGDTIVFQYKKEFHNVVRVTHKNYNLCNATGSYRTWTSGNDSFTIPRTGHYFFICGFPGHCEGGQRVDIRVPKAAPSPSPTPVAAAPKASSPHIAPKSSPSTTPSPHVAPKASPTSTPAPKASSPHVSPKESPISTPPAPKAVSPDTAPESSMLPPAEPLRHSPAPSPTSSATPSLTSKHLFLVATIVSVFCF